MIDKLSHPTFRHPEPYKLHWLNDGSTVEVTKQALVTFHFGPDYEDQILCDVLPMDAFHLLLGRPWQSDRDTTRSGRKKTDSFQMNGRTITLTPGVPVLAPSSDQTSKTKQRLILTNITKGESLYYLHLVEKGEERHS